MQRHFRLCTAAGGVRPASLSTIISGEEEVGEVLHEERTVDLEVEEL